LIRRFSFFTLLLGLVSLYPGLPRCTRRKGFVAAG
jgi:hypothetical protein